jgi:transcription elongation factor Elf1
MTSNPFRIFEVGEPGKQQAVAEFTCPKCGEISRFTAESEDANGDFVCPHCELAIQIQGARLSEYQKQLDSIDAQLGGLASEVEKRIRKAAEEIAAEADDGPEGRVN